MIDSFLYMRTSTGLFEALFLEPKLWFRKKTLILDQTSISETKLRIWVVITSWKRSFKSELFEQVGNEVLNVNCFNKLETKF